MFFFSNVYLQTILRPFMWDVILLGTRVLTIITILILFANYNDNVSEMSADVEQAQDEEYEDDQEHDDADIISYKENTEIDI